MRPHLKIILTILVVSIIIKIIHSLIKRTSISIKSFAFDHMDDNSLTLGNSNVHIPALGEGIYAVSLMRNLSGIKNRIMYMGPLRINTFQTQLEKIDVFFKKSIADGFSYVALFSIGSTHEKNVLEIIRTGISIGELDDVSSILKNYDIKKLISFSNGLKKPYIFIRNTQTGDVIERTGSTGGKLIANL